jgi:hypothetical protein
LILGINYVGQIQVLSHEVVNNGSSLIVVANKGEMVFCSDTVMATLGYSNEELVAYTWKPKAPWYLSKELHNDSIAGRTYVRKANVKWRIQARQWSEKKEYSEFGIGFVNVTNEIKTQKDI